MKRTKLEDREFPDYTKGEEIFNMVSHIAGGALGICYLVITVIIAAFKGNVWAVVSSSIYGASNAVLFAISATYHGLNKSTAKKVMQILDHCTIFFMIAGTYTPVSLVTLRSVNKPLGWVIFGIVWTVAVMGIVLNSIDLKKYQVFSMISYLAMGWCIIFTIKQVFEATGTWGLFFLVFGGVMYTIGSVFFLIRKRYAHSVFHIFVVLGSICHFVFIAFYVI